ncbi:MAG: 50S ribosomal protein L33 [bacterium]
MAKQDKIIIVLACTKCKRRNYTFRKNKKHDAAQGKLEIKKYCKFCRLHTLHKQTK